MVRFIKNTPLADKSRPILYPGEIEAEAHRKAGQIRIGLEQATSGSPHGHSAGFFDRRYRGLSGDQQGA